MKKLLYIIPILLLLFGFGIGNPDPTVYYVNTAADAGGDGTTQELTGEHCAFKTIAQVNAASPAAGDSVLFNKGNTWRETLTVPTSGSDGLPITFGAYGTGVKPKILASIAKNSTGDWINESANLWYVNASKRIYNVIMDSENAVATMVANKVDLDAQGEAWWDSTNSRIYVYSTSNPATYYNGSIECAQQQMFIYVEEFMSYIVIDSLDMRYTGDNGIYVDNNSENITIQNCTIKYVGSNQSGYVSAIQSKGTHIIISNNTFYSIFRAIGIIPTLPGCVVTIENNIISKTVGEESAADGIFVWHPDTVGDFNGSIIRGNDISEFADDGIDLFWAKNMTVEGNTIHDSTRNGDGNGIKAGGVDGTTGNQILRNHIYNINTGDNHYGITTNNGSDGKIAYNIVHDVERGIEVDMLTESGGNNNWEIYNNVLYDCSYIGIYVDAGIDANNQLYATVQNNICDGQTHDMLCEQFANITGGYNCLINDASVHGTCTYEGSENDLYETDPLMIDPANDNFKLNPHSPCVNAGTDVSLTEDYEGLKIRHAPDIGAHENQANVLFFSWFLKDFLGVNK